MSTGYMIAHLCNEPGRGWSSKPWSAVIRGTRYVGATNGHALLVVQKRGNYKEPPAEAQNLMAKVLVPEAPASAWAAIDLAALKDWAAGPYPECRMCHGSGDHKCECGTVHDCHPCEGKGVVDVQPGTVSGVLVNRRLLLRYLEPSGTVATAEIGTSRADEGDMLHVRGKDWQGDDWQATIMYMRLKPDEDRGPTFPAAT